MDMDKRVTRAVRSVLEDVFPKIEITSINVAEHFDDDGEKVIEIQVVFDADDRDFDPRRLGELPRLIMPKLDKLKEDGFPLFSFVSKSDLGKKKTAAA